ncbi:MAG: extracellular solute-binding protein [Lachnospiraceae bacterium]
MYYNKDMLTEAGIDLPSTDAASPWSWDEFVRSAKKMTKGQQRKWAEMMKGSSPGGIGVLWDEVTN